jgi:ABC-type Fe3+/spermidine/putrescine transport system ATPase subunit
VTVRTHVALRGLAKTYPGAEDPVVPALDLDVEPGQLLALLGPSGCGKTTTLKMVAGLLEPSGGDILFDGASIVRTPAERRPVAMVFQKPLLFPHLTVAENVGFGPRMRGAPRREVRARVAELLELVRLPGLGDRRPGELSGGQEQRVALARALITEPGLLLLDEPFSQLDANLRVEVRDLVRSLQRELGVTTLFVTHDQEEAVVLADRIGLMLGGRLEQVGTPQDFYERPATAAVARFFGTANLLPGEARGATFAIDGAEGAVPLAAPAPDGRGLLVVRQEAVELAEGGLPAVVVATTYVGTHVRALLRVGAVELACTVPPTTRLAAGDRVGVRLPPERCTVVPEDVAASTPRTDPERR